MASEQPNNQELSLEFFIPHLLLIPELENGKVNKTLIVLFIK